MRNLQDVTYCCRFTISDVDLKQTSDKQMQSEHSKQNVLFLCVWGVVFEENSYEVCIRLVATV